jgi:hypothetical protein
VARVDVAGIPGTSPGDAARYVVLGTVLYEPVLLALRRLAQQHVFGETRPPPQECPEDDEGPRP